MTARVAIAVRPASLIATPSGSVGEHERALQRARRRQAAPLGHGAAADEAWIDAVEPQKEGNDRQRRAHEYDQRLRVAVDAPRFRRDRERKPKTQHHEQEAPFGHEADAGDEAEEKRTVPPSAAPHRRGLR